MIDEPFKLRTRIREQPPTVSETETLAVRLQVIEETQTEKAKALQKITEFLQITDVQGTELDVLELEILRLLKKKLEV